MGIYSEVAPKYWKNGLITIPCEGKIPKVFEWQKWAMESDLQRQKINKYINEKPNSNIGLILGSVNKLIALDIDVEDESFLQDLMAKVPVSLYRKKGKKGITLFYEYSDNLAQKSDRFEKDGKSYQVEILSEGNQTVIPPSIHPQTNKKYEWVGPFNLEDTSALDLDLRRVKNEDIFSLFYSIAEKHGLKRLCKNKGDIGRNEKLKSVVVSMLSRKESLTKIVSEILGVDLLHLQPLFEDKNEKIKGNNPEEKALNFIKSIKKSLDNNNVNLIEKPAPELSSNSEADDKKSLRTKYKFFKEFFDKDLKEAIREKLSGELKIKEDSGYWQPVISGIKSMKSRAHQNNLSHNYTEIHLSQYIQSIPLGLLIKPEKWDGSERLLKIFSHFKFAEDKLDQENCWLLFKEWCANIFRRIDNPMSQNRILIFRGAQGIGKDYFIENVVGKALGPYFVNLEPQDSNKENFIAIHGKLLANISEFDQTNRMAISSLKNMITSSHQRIRMPYEPAARDYQFHCSFFASSNFDSILRDSSGNRRFLIFDIESIQKDYDKHIDSDQILAEMYQWYLDDFRAPKECYDALDGFIQQETPESVDDLALELAVKLINDAVSKKSSIHGAKVEYSDIKDGVLSIAKNLGISSFRVLNVIKRNGMRKRDGKSSYYIAL